MYKKRLFKATLDHIGKNHKNRYTVEVAVSTIEKIFKIMKITRKTKLVLIFILFSFLFLPSAKTNASVSQDYEYYQKYPLSSKYDKYKKYSEYRKLQKIKKELGFDDLKKKEAAKTGYNNYRLYKKDPKKYASFAKYAQLYKDYKKYQKYSGASKYKKFKKFNDKKYEKYKKYGGDEYEAGYNRYVAFMNDISSVTTNTGPEIRVGLWSKNHLDAASEPFRITANKSFTVTNCDSSTVIGTIPVDSTIRVAYDSGGNLKVYDSTSLIIPETVVGEKVCLQATDGNSADMIFDVNTPTNLSKAGYEHYRGKIKLQHSYSTDNYDLYSSSSFADNDTEHAMRRIWVINILPLEHYMWGFGEMSSGGVSEHAKAMIVAARSYARWYIEYATKWGDTAQEAGEDGEGFDILSYSSSQIYNGYDYETDHSFIPEAARATNGIVMTYGNEYVLGAYCSYTDGNTRSLSGYPYLASVSDPYGKNSSMTTEEMVAAGNHMWGMSANGSLVLARDYDWKFTGILSYYYTGINIGKSY